MRNDAEMSYSRQGQAFAHVRISHPELTEDEARAMWRQAGD
jgi:hypothetical protein